MKIGRVLIIAGSDSGGGAGVQADLKTVTALGQYAATAITALTVQNTLGVTDVFAAPPAIVQAQIEAVAGDIGADVVKTGMLGAAAMVEAVAETLAARLSGVPVVVDPVMVAKGGQRLLDEDAVAAVAGRLAPLAAVITPNAPEAERLTGLAVEDVAGQVRAGEALLRLGARAALVKGGHIPGAVITDVLVTAAGVRRFESARIESRATHGTGCTLASAIAAGLAGGLGLEEAILAAQDYLRGAIAAAPGFGAGHQPMHHGWRLAGN